MADKIENNEQNDHEPKNKASNPDGLTLNIMDRMEKYGLSYIKHQKFYLYVAVIFPLYIIIVNFITLRLFVLSRPLNPNNPGHISFNSFIPGSQMTLLFIFAIINLIFLIKWKLQVEVMEDYSTEMLSNENNVEEQSITSRDISDNDLIPENEGEEITLVKPIVTLTRLFYNIVNNMEIIRKIFIIINIICAFTFYWFISFFIFGKFPIHMEETRWMMARFLNISSQLIALAYLVVQWVNFLHWNKKLRNLRDFERKIYEELDL